MKYPRITDLFRIVSVCTLYNVIDYNYFITERLTFAGRTALLYIIEALKMIGAISN